MEVNSYRQYRDPWPGKMEMLALPVRRRWVNKDTEEYGSRDMWDSENVIFALYLPMGPRCTDA